jgi:hypothetical protein
MSRREIPSWFTEAITKEEPDHWEDQKVAPWE